MNDPRALEHRETVPVNPFQHKLLERPPKRDGDILEMRVIAAGWALTIMRWTGRPR